MGGADQAGSGAAHRARGTQRPERGNPPTVARGSNHGSHAVRACAAAGRQRSAHVVDARAPRRTRERGRYAVRERRFWRCATAAGTYVCAGEAGARLPCVHLAHARRGHAQQRARAAAPPPTPHCTLADMLGRTSRTYMRALWLVHCAQSQPVEIVQLAETSITYRTFVYESLLFWILFLFGPFGRARFQATNSDSK